MEWQALLTAVWRLFPGINSALMTTKGKRKMLRPEVIAVGTATRLLRWGVAVSLNRTDPLAIIFLMKAPAVVTGALPVESWLSVINSD